MLGDYLNPKHDVDAEPQAMAKIDQDGKVFANHITEQVGQGQHETRLPILATAIEDSLRSTGSLRILKLHDIECSSEVLEQFLNKVLDLVNPETGLQKLEFVRIKIFGSLSSDILTRIVSLSKKLEEYTIENFPEIENSTRDFFMELTV